MAVTDHIAGGASAMDAAPERAARADLRAQIARLERELARLTVSTHPHLHDGPPRPYGAAAGGPRVLGLGELERVRDGLASRLVVRREAAAAQAVRQARARERLGRMLADPPAYRRQRVTNADLGLPGCTTYAVHPRLGPLGMLAGWWQVKVSSGCP